MLTLRVWLVQEPAWECAAAKAMPSPSDALMPARPAQAGSMTPQLARRSTPSVASGVHRTIPGVSCAAADPRLMLRMRGAAAAASWHCRLGPLLCRRHGCPCLLRLPSRCPTVAHGLQSPAADCRCRGLPEPRRRGCCRRRGGDSLPEGDRCCGRKTHPAPHTGSPCRSCLAVDRRGPAPQALLVKVCAMSNDTAGQAMADALVAGGVTARVAAKVVLLMVCPDNEYYACELRRREGAARRGQMQPCYLVHTFREGSRCLRRRVSASPMPPASAPPPSGVRQLLSGLAVLGPRPGSAAHQASGPHCVRPEEVRAGRLVITLANAAGPVPSPGGQPPFVHPSAVCLAAFLPWCRRYGGALVQAGDELGLAGCVDYAVVNSEGVVVATESLHPALAGAGGGAGAGATAGSDGTISAADSGDSPAYIRLFSSSKVLAWAGRDPKATSSQWSRQSRSRLRLPPGSGLARRFGERHHHLQDVLPTSKEWGPSNSTWRELLEAARRLPPPPPPAMPWMLLYWPHDAPPGPALTSSLL